MDFVDDRKRTLAYFVIDPAEIFAQHTQAEQDSAADKEYGGGHPQPTALTWRVDDQAASAAIAAMPQAIADSTKLSRSGL